MSIDSPFGATIKVEAPPSASIQVMSSVRGFWACVEPAAPSASTASATPVAIFFMNLVAKRPITVFARKQAGDAGCVRDYVYVSDVVRANIAALADDWQTPIMNVGTGRAVTTLELAKQIGKCLDIAVEPAFGPMRPGDVERSVLDHREDRADDDLAIVVLRAAM